MWVYHAFKKDAWNPSICTSGNGRNLKSIAITLIIVCNEIINAMVIVSTNATQQVLYQQMLRVLY